jgi:hypothetical protein
VLSRPDWSRPLPRPLTIPTVMKLSTLADVRDLVEKHSPAQYRHKPTWRHVSSQLAKAADGERTYSKFACRFGWCWRWGASSP